MKRAMSWTLLVAGAALTISAAPAMPATAAASGGETLSGTIVFAAEPGATTRTVTASVVVAESAFRSVGRFVEVVPGDLVSQDDLVFPGGTLHVVSTLGSPSPFSLDPHSCMFTGTSPLTWQVTGGTGQFAGTTGTLTGTVSGRALFAATPTAAARSCHPRFTRWTSSRRAGRCRSDERAVTPRHPGLHLHPATSA